MQVSTVLFAIVAGIGSAQTTNPAAVPRDWVLVRSVSNKQGGTMDFVVVPVDRQRDRPHYESISNAVCG